jgi:hypothetical protein
MGLFVTPVCGCSWLQEMGLFLAAMGEVVCDSSRCGFFAAMDEFVCGFCR